MSSKNNPENRGQAAQIKKVNGKPVKPVLYVGKQKGHGNYIAAQFENGELVLDGVTKRPTPYKKI